MRAGSLTTITAPPSLPRYRPSMANDRTDHELLEAARRDDREALESLLQRHERLIYGLGMRLCRHSDDAQEVLQDTMLAVARHVKGFRRESSLSTWLYAIARSACIKRRTRGRSVPAAMTAGGREGLSLADRMPDPAPDPSESAAARELVVRLRSAFDCLTPAQREVIVLRDGEGMSSAEVADALGIDLGAVKARLHRARERLQSCLGAM